MKRLLFCAALLAGCDSDQITGRIVCDIYRGDAYVISRPSDIRRMEAKKIKEMKPFCMEKIPSIAERKAKLKRDVAKAN